MEYLSPALDGLDVYKTISYYVNQMFITSFLLDNTVVRGGFFLQSHSLKPLLKLVMMKTSEAENMDFWVALNKPANISLCQVQFLGLSDNAKVYASHLISTDIRNSSQS